jgi:hypothetical protein
MTTAHARIVRSGMVVALAATLMCINTSPATAHETRQVGRFTFVVGFSGEPAYTNIPNAVSLSITETASEDPFVDLTDTLDVDVRFGGQTMTKTMEPAFIVGVFGTPGEYTADFVPSRPGQYTFHFHGTVGGVQIDEEFVSGPETFNDVEDLSAASFPAKDPSTGELAERLDQEIARLSDEASDQESESTSDDVALWLAAGAGLVALVALGTAIVAVRRRA